MLIVDAQVHIWGSGTPSGAHRKTSVFSADALLSEMDEAGVDAAIIHPPGWDPNSGELALEAARNHPNRLSILGKIPLDEPEHHGLIDSWTSQPGMLGLRYVFAPRQQSWPRMAMDWLWPCGRARWVLIALLAAIFSPLLVRLRAHPGLKPSSITLVDSPALQDEAAWSKPLGTFSTGEVSQWTSRLLGPRATPVNPTPIPISTPICANSTMPLVPSDCSGARTSPACLAPGGSV